MSGVGRRLEPPLGLCHYPVYAHELGYSVFTARKASVPQILGNAWAPVCATAGLVKPPDSLQKGLVLLQPSSGIPFSQPGVIAAPCYIKKPAHPLHREPGA